jgi:hypothetical protein
VVKGGDMTKDSQDELARAYAMLSSLRNNIAQMGAVEETYVREFHTVLTKLEGIGIDVSEFRISASEVTPLVTSINTLTGETTYSKEKYVHKSFILTKLDAILAYLGSITSEKPRRIGFSKPDNQ